MCPQAWKAGQEAKSSNPWKGLPTISYMGLFSLASGILDTAKSVTFDVVETGVNLAETAVDTTVSAAKLDPEGAVDNLGKGAKQTARGVENLFSDLFG